MSKLYDLLSSVVVKLNKTIKTEAQTLTEEQKTQARANIDALGSDALSSITHSYYGVCSTASKTAAKTVEIEGFKLEEGAVVVVKFVESSGVASPTLNVSGTGAKPMYRYGTTVTSTGTTTTGWVAGAVQTFVYDGTGWIREYWNNTTYTNVSLGHGYATCSTAASTVDKTASLSSYALTTGGIVAVKFTNAVPADATLNVNSKGAKAIYHRGEKIKAGVIDSGDTATFVYNGTYYHLISIDKAKLPNPHPLTVNGTTYDGSEPVNIEITGGGSGGVANADWNENDPSTDGYIKNRPFYSEYVPTVLLDNQYLGGGNYEGELQLVAGQMYHIVCTGSNIGTVEYDREAFAFDFYGLPAVGLGNMYFLGLEETEEFFGAVSTDGQGMVTDVYANEITITITTSNEEITKIPEKYLPETAPYRFKLLKSSGGVLTAVTFVSKLEEILQSGREVIAEFIQEDSPEISYDLTLALRGVADENGHRTLGFTCDAVAEKIAFGLIPNEDDMYDVQNMSWAYGDSDSGGSGGADIDVTANVGQTIVVKEVDTNGKPTKWEAASYQPRTHYWEDIRELLEPAEVEMEVFEDYSMVEGEHDGFGLEIGKDYCVEWNGETYVVQAKDFSGITYIGRIPLDFGDTENTSIPFSIMNNYGEETFFVLAYDKTEILSMSLKEVNVKKIPEVFMPSSEDDEQIMYVDFMPANWDTTDELTCRSTILFTDIMGAISSGKTVYARVNKSDLFWAHPELELFVNLPSFILSLASDVTKLNEVDIIGYWFTGTITKISFELAVRQGSDGGAYGTLSFVNLKDKAGGLLVVTAALDDNGELRSDYESEEILTHVTNGGYAILRYYGQVFVYYGYDNQDSVIFYRIDSGTNFHPEILYVTIKQKKITYHTEKIIQDMIGATDYQGGLNGLVPAPTAGDNNKFLRGDGTWAEVSGGSGEWKLLNTIVTTEEIAVQTGIHVDTTDDGEPYDFKELIIDWYCPAASGPSYATFRLNGKSVNYLSGASYFASGIFITSTERKAILRAVAMGDAGLLSGFGEINGYGTYGSAVNVMYKYPSEFESIRSIDFTAFGNIVFPAGLKITIYGVK